MSCFEKTAKESNKQKVKKRNKLIKTNAQLVESQKNIFNGFHVSPL